MPEPIIIKFQTDLTQVESAIDALEQLGAVDKKTADEFRKTAATVKAHNEELTKTGKNVDSVTIDVQEMVKAIKDIPKNIISDSAKKSLEEGGKVVDQMATKSQRLTTQLRAMKQELSQMEQAGLSNTATYKKLAAEAGKLEDQIGDTAKRVKILASDSRNLDAALSLATGVAGGFAVAQGAAALFGSENEDLQKALLKVQAALAIVNGLQAVAATLNKDSAASVVLLGAVQKAWTAYIGASTGALRLLKVAMVGLGIGALIIGVTLLIQNWDKLTGSVKNMTTAIDGVSLSTETYNELSKRTADGYIDQKVKLEALVRIAKDHSLTLDARQKAVKSINELSPKYLGDITLETIETNKATTAIAQYIKSLELKAKAQAYESLLVEKNKELIELQNEDLGDQVKWYDIFKGKSAVMAAARKREADATSDLESEISNLETGYFNVNEQIIKAGDGIDLFTNKVEEGSKKLKSIARENNINAMELSPLPTPDELENEIIEPSIKITTDFYEKMRELQEQEKEKYLEDLQEMREARAQSYQKIEQIAFSSFDTLSDISNTFLNNELANLQAQLASKQISQDQYDKKAAEAKTKEAKREKTLNFFKSLVQIPEAFLKGLVEGGPGLALFYGALASIESGLILAQKIPAFAKGIRRVEGGTPGKDSVLSMLMPGEGVITADVNQEYDPILTAIHNKTIPSDFLNSIAGMPDFNMMAGLMMKGFSVPVFNGIDYDLLAEKLGNKIADLPISQTIFDEHGFRRSIKNGGNRTDYLNKRYMN